jgi:hypothetical protein
MQHKDKWALTFDEGGCRYGIMTTNAPELFNKVFKGIGVMPMSRIVEYTFRKCNKYFVNRWNTTKLSKEEM